jgi:transcription initiation factor TFIID subunit 11
LRLCRKKKKKHDNHIHTTMASPPHIPQLNISSNRKRGSISSHSGAPTKKRKPSNLRNAFSPDAESVGGSPRQYSRSPSVESNITTSVVNGVGGGKKRRKKGGDGGSVAGSSVRGGKSGDGRSAVGGEDEEGEEGEDDDEDEMGEEMGMEIEGGMSVEARRKQEKEYERYVFIFFLYHCYLRRRYCRSFPN